MQLQDRNLSDGMQGDDVALLHSELVRLHDAGLLDAAIDPEEVAGQVFGPTTRQAVARFQSAQNLTPPDVATGVVDPITARRINEVVDASQGDGSSNDTGFVVRGTVQSAGRQAFTGGSVRAYDVDMRSEEALGDAPIKTDGSYEIRYTREQFRHAEKASADLRVCVLDEAGRELVTSDTLFNAAAEETVNFVVATDADLLSEYEKHVAALLPLMQDVPFDALEEKDIRFLSGESGIAARQIAFLALAYRHATALGVDEPAVFYGLFREDLPTNLPALLLIPPSRLNAALERAVAANVIPDALRPRLDELLDQFSRGRGKQLLAAEGREGFSVQALLATTGAPTALQEEFLDLYARRESSLADFWSGLAEQPGFQKGDAVESFRFVLQAGLLTGNNAALVGALQELRQQGTFATMQDLTAWDDADWQAIIQKASEAGTLLPDGLAGETPDEQIRTYVAGIRDALQQSFPTAAIRHGIVAHEHLPENVRRDVLRFFDNAPDFDFRDANVRRYLEQNGEKALQGIVDRDGTVQELKRLRRVFQVAPRFDHMKALLDAGLDSACSVSAMPLKNFVRDFGDILGGEMQARSYHGNAGQISSLAMVSAASIQQVFGDPTPAALGGNQGKKAVDDALKTLPTLEGLFGSLDLCECRHCNAVYGFAAYHTDCLQFLRKSSIVPFNVLRQRRPDLEHIELTCENALTPLPYVDLVNEVLEFYVEHGELTKDLAHNTEGVTAEELSANPQYVSDNAYEKLKTAIHGFHLPFNNPLEVTRAYLEHLGTSWHEVMTVFTPPSGQADLDRAAEYLGLSPEESVIVRGQSPAAAEEFYGWFPGDLTPLLASGDTGVFVQILQRKLNTAGTSPALETDGKFDAKTAAALQAFQTAQGLTADGKTGPQTWAALEGIEPDTLDFLLGHVPTFLSRTELEYTDLVELVKTRFVNPDQTSTPLPDTTVVLYSPNSVCDLEQTWIQHLDGTTLPRSQWKDIHRFLRLRNTLGWTMQELDKAIQSLNGTALGDTFLVDVAHLQWLRNELSLPVVEILTLWSNMDTFGPAQTTLPSGTAVTEPSLYEKLFQNKAVLSPPDPAFTLTAPPALPEIAGDGQSPTTLSAHEAAVSAALRVGAGDLAALRQATGLNDGGAALDLASITALYRHSLLARALRLPVQEYLSLLILLGADPSQPLTPAASVDLAERARRVQESSFSVTQLGYLYRHWSAPGANVAPLLENVTQLLAKLRADLQSVADETVPVADPTGEVLREKLSLAVDAALVEPAALLIEGKEGKPILSAAEQEAFIDAHLSDFLDPNDAKAILVTPSPPLPEAVTQAHRDYVLPPLLAYLRDTLSRNLIRQTLADALHLEEAATRALVEEVLPSSAQSSQPLVADFLALSGDGLNGEYFANANLTGPPVLQRIDPRVSFDWPDGTPDSQIAAGPFSVRWTGTLMASQAEAVTLYIWARGGVRLRIDGQLAIDQWNATAVPAEHAWTSPEPVEVGRLYVVELEYASAGGAGAIDWRWSSRSTPKALVPQSHLYSGTASVLIDILVRSYGLLHKIALLVNGFAMSADELAYLTGHGVDFQNLDLAGLPLDRSDSQTVDAQAPALFAQWEALAALFSLRERLPRHDLTLLDVIGAPTPETSRQALASLTRWTKQDIDDLSVALALPDAAFRNAAAPTQLWDAFRLARRLGVSVQTVIAWFSPNVDAQQRAKELVQAVKARYDEESWLAAARPLNDALRARRKEALLAYVLADKDIVAKNIGNADRLYQYFLIDVNMDPCFMTSRLKQAAASVQLFVQRCLMNLEPDVPPDLIDEDRWDWMKNYRVWEANRKVFLYTENYIEPTLRGDMTPPFKEYLVNGLRQGEPTDENIEQAFIAYLEGLDETARLEPMGLCVDPDDKTLLHIFARTPNEPHIYYYRQFAGATESWSPWEKVELDIAGDHLIPVVWNRRLHLFWPIFRETTDSAVQKFNGYDLPEGAPPIKDWEIKLAWSEYRQGKWSPKKISSTAVASVHFWDDAFARLFPIAKANHPTEEHQYLHLPEPQYHYFVPTVWNGLLSIACFRKYVEHYPLYEVEGGYPPYEVYFPEGQPPWGPPFSGHDRLGEFVFWGCGSEVDVLVNPLPPVAEHTGPKDTLNDAMGFSHPATKGRLTLPAPGEEAVLEATPTPYAFLPADDNVDLATPYYPFLFEDLHRVYLAAPARQQRTSLIPNEPFLKGAIDLYGASDSAFQSLPYKQSTNTTHFALAPGQPLAGRTFFSGTLNQATAGALTSSSSAALIAKANSAGGKGGQTILYKADGSDISTINEPTLSAAEAMETRFKFHTLFHPHVCALFKRLNQDGIAGLLTLENQRLTDDLPIGTNLFKATYQPANSVHQELPLADVDFLGGAYSIYNWELFFHAPLLIADTKRQHQRFEEALVCYFWLLAPLIPSAKDDPKEYWRFLPFSQNSESGRILDLLEDLNHGEWNKRKKVLQQVAEWRDNPFEPHRIARMRWMAYEKYVAYKIIETLIALGDARFLRNTMESINEATQYYVMAAELLGERPPSIPSRGKIEPMTYAELRPQLDAFSNALVELENEFPYVSEIPSSGNGSPGTDGLGTATTFYFCLPPNEQLMALWDTVADRLFKIRHCMNIEGVVRQLPLFEPPIDPALLVRARAMGLDVGSVLDDLNAPLGPYRPEAGFPICHALCAAVESYGAAFLAALEKMDGEELASLRARQETDLLKLVKEVRKDQIQEAVESLAALRQSLAAARSREAYYTKNIEEQLNAEEKLHLEKLDEANKRQEESTWLEIMAQSASLIPNLTVGIGGGSPPGPMLTLGFGGSDISASFSATARFWNWRAINESYKANKAAIKGSHHRRRDEWTFQKTQATHDIARIEKEILTAELRLAIAEKELANTERNIEHKQAEQDFLRDKFTNQELYSWMIDRLSADFFQAHKLAYEVCRGQQKICRHALGRDSFDFIQFGYWDNLHKGLLAGERLHLDLRRMEVAYRNANRREYELTKHVSLLQIDPLALIRLRTTGSCTVVLPEELFDMDCPGHYFRRIKTLALTIPCVTGPYASVNCTLTLLNSHIRKTPIIGTQYARFDAEDNRFEDYFGSLQSTVTSSAQNDSGQFETNLNDERLLHFEYSGVISELQLALSANPSDGELTPFNYDTISDVILHIRYTAREGGRLLRDGAVANIKSLYSDPDAVGHTRLFSIRHEFPAEWARFLKQEPATNQRYELALELREEHYPFWAKGRTKNVAQIHILVRRSPESASPTVEVADTADTTNTNVDTLSQNPVYGNLLEGKLSNALPGNPIGPLKLFFEDNAMSDLLVAVTWNE